MTSAAKDQPIASGGGEVDWSIHAVGELQIAAQEWHPSDTRDCLVQIKGEQIVFDKHL